MPNEKRLKHRMYIDEVGHHGDFADPKDPGQRYLSLTGVIFELGYVANTLFPKLELIKNKYFHQHPDEPVILHRKDIVNKKPPFTSLNNPDIEKQFNQDILNLFKELDYVVITVVLDKKQHKDQYRIWRHHPYHYCMEVIVERFVLYLESIESIGDVMCESRGGTEDNKLKSSFHRLWENGTDFVSAQKFQEYLTSSQLKIKPKHNNIPGLQVADLLAHPSYKRILIQKGRAVKRYDTFGEKIVKILEEEKYYRGTDKRLWGFGKKWLPK